MSKHTPGPWTIKSRNNPHEWDVVKLETPEPDVPWFIAAVFDGAEGRASIDNARLIAAAPDMRDALAVVRLSAGWFHLAPSTQELIEAVLAKAEGR